MSIDNGLPPMFTIRDQWGDDYKVDLSVDTYANNGNLAICLYNYDEVFYDFEPYANLTVNIKELPPYLAAIDTNNLGEGIVDQIAQAGLIESGAIGYLTSGYCSYPVVEFVPEKLAELSPETAAHYAKATEKMITENEEKLGEPQSLNSRYSDAKQVSERQMSESIDELNHDMNTSTR